MNLSIFSISRVCVSHIFTLRNLLCAEGKEGMPIRRRPHPLFDIADKERGVMRIFWKWLNGNFRKESYENGRELKRLFNSYWICSKKRSPTLTEQKFSAQ